MNPARFYEYALSSSWMIVLIGLLVGIWDLGAVILLFTVNATMNLFGIMMEYHNQYTEKTNWTSFVFGSIAGIVPWIVIMVYFLSAVSSAGAEPPGFVYAIIPTIFVFFNSIPSSRTYLPKSSFPTSLECLTLSPTPGARTRSSDMGMSVGQRLYPMTWGIAEGQDLSARE